MQEFNVYKVPAEIEGYIKSIIDKEEYISYNVNTKHIIMNGHFMGQLYTIDVDGKTIDGDKEINLFIKQIIDNKDEMKVYTVSDLYLKEYIAYLEVFKLFKELQDEMHIPVNERYTTPISYDESTQETMILENLTKKGFTTYYRMDIVPLKYAELCMQEIAKFHSLSFVIQKKRPEFFDKIISFKQPYNFGEDWYGYTKNMYNVTIAYLEDDVRDKVAQKVSDIVDKYPLYMTDTTSVCTLCHGDYRLSNIMVKEMNGEASEVIPVDFQLMHYGNPIHDVIYFIFSSTDNKFRESHMEHLKNMYYQNLKAFLEHFQIDVESVYPREHFERDFKEKLDLGMMLNVFNVPLMFSSEDDVPDITAGELTNITFKIDELFRDRFRGTVDDFIKWGYL